MICPKCGNDTLYCGPVMVSSGNSDEWREEWECSFDTDSQFENDCYTVLHWAPAPVAHPTPANPKPTKEESS